MAVAKTIGARYYLECSAKSGEGVREVFHFAARAALLSRSVLFIMCSFFSSRDLSVVPTGMFAVPVMFHSDHQPFFKTHLPSLQTSHLHREVCCCLNVH